ncbi:hypothetical protein B0H19DRAFT_1271779 [Mycena capillaripes]|nr:hypothetical protein B0H19DRAFT_1271779 [Mycena capillaripes]
MFFPQKNPSTNLNDASLFEDMDSASYKERFDSLLNTSTLVSVQTNANFDTAVANASFFTKDVHEWGVPSYDEIFDSRAASPQWLMEEGLMPFQSPLSTKQPALARPQARHFPATCKGPISPHPLAMSQPLPVACVACPALEDAPLRPSNDYDSAEEIADKRELANQKFSAPRPMVSATVSPSPFDAPSPPSSEVPSPESLRDFVPTSFSDPSSEYHGRELPSLEWEDDADGEDVESAHTPPPLTDAVTSSNPPSRPFIPLPLRRKVTQAYPPTPPSFFGSLQPLDNDESDSENDHEETYSELETSSNGEDYGARRRPRISAPAPKRKRTNSGRPPKSHWHQQSARAESA